MDTPIDESRRPVVTARRQGAISDEAWHAGLAGFPRFWLTVGLVLVDGVRDVTPGAGATFPLPW